MDEYGFSWSGNFSNKLYLGVGVNIQSMSYSLLSSYKEQSDADYFQLRNDYTASGVGVNIKLGAIYKINDAFRISAAIHTPTGFTMREDYFPQISYDTETNADGVKAGTTYPEDGASHLKYSLTSPFKANVGLAYIIGKKGLISAEYGLATNKGTLYADEDGDTFDYQYDNDRIKDAYKLGHTFKVGGEYRANSNMSWRAGFAYATGITTSDAYKDIAPYTARTDAEYFLSKNTMYGTLGFGYQENGWYFDVAYMYKTQSQEFMPFTDRFFENKISPAKLTIDNHNIVATLGLRF
jgi:long-subunit fatty acid transport protein